MMGKLCQASGASVGVAVGGTAVFVRAAVRVGSGSIRSAERCAVGVDCAGAAVGTGEAQDARTASTTAAELARLRRRVGEGRTRGGEVICEPKRSARGRGRDA